MFHQTASAQTAMVIGIDSRNALSWSGSVDALSGRMSLKVTTDPRYGRILAHTCTVAIPGSTFPSKCSIMAPPPELVRCQALNTFCTAQLQDPLPDTW